MRVTIMRHGATPGNERRLYVGRTDEPLSERGVEQCRRAGVRQDVRMVYASPLRRAVQTAELCFPRARVVPVRGLEEFDFGVFEGRCADDMEHDAAYRAWVESGCMAPCPGGETIQGFRARTREALLGVLQAAVAQGEREVVVVAHGGTVMAALDRFFEAHVGNCEGYVATARVGRTSFVLEDPRRFDRLPMA